MPRPAPRLSPTFPTIQSFHSYAALARLWPVSSSTIARWVADLRRERPDLVYGTYRLAHGYRRTLYLAGSTVAVLQARHFPLNRAAPKVRGTGSKGFWRPRTPLPASAPLTKRLVLPPMPRRERSGSPMFQRVRDDARQSTINDARESTNA